MVWMWSNDGQGQPNGHQGSTASIDCLPPPLHPSAWNKPGHEPQGPGIRAWQHGWTPLGPSGGLRMPSPAPQVGGFSISAPTYGGPIEVPVVVKGQGGPHVGGEHDLGMPRTRYNDLKAVPVRGVSPGPQTHLQQPQLQSSRSASPMPMPGGYPQQASAAPQQAAVPGRPVTPRRAPPAAAGQLAAAALQPQWSASQFSGLPSQAPVQPTVAMPGQLLARIDGVVSEMERELQDGSVQTPRNGSQRAASSQHASSQHASTGNPVEGRPNVEWLDKQILAIEQRREACEMRQKHLAELRRIVADGKAPDAANWSLTDDGNIMEGGGSQGSAPRQQSSAREGISEADAEASSDLPSGRLTLLEREHHALKQQVREFEREHSNIGEQPAEFQVDPAQGLHYVRPTLEDEVRSNREGAGNHMVELRSANQAVDAEKRRSLLAEEVANERVMHAALETHTLHERLYEAQEALVRERRFSEHAAEAQQSAEADLRTLENKSRDVLQDCRALQATVLELEEERVQMGEAQALASQRIAELELELSGVLPNSRHDAAALRIEELEADLASQAHHARHVVELESELSEQRTMHESVQQHAKLLTARVSDLESQVGQARALQEHREAEVKVHVGKIQELEELIGSGQAFEVEKRALSCRLKEYEQELAECRSNEARYRSQCEHHLAQTEGIEEARARDTREQRQRIAILEQQLSDTEAAEAAHTQTQSLQKARLQELEEELSAGRAQEDTHARQHSTQRSTIADLEGQLEELRATQEFQNKQQGSHRTRVLELEAQVDELRASEANQSRQLGSQKNVAAVLEQELQDATAAKDSANRQLQSQKQRVVELEEELEQVRSAEAGHLRKHQSFQARVSELESLQLQSAAGTEENHARELATHRERITALELENEEIRKSQAHQSRIDELLLELEEVRKSEAELSNKHAVSVGELDQKVVGLTKELGEERARLGMYRDELETARKATADTQQLCQDAMEKQDVLRAAKEREYEEQANMRVQELQLKLEQKQEDGFGGADRGGGGGGGGGRERFHTAAEGTEDELSDAKLRIEKLEQELALAAATSVQAPVATLPPKSVTIDSRGGLSPTASSESMRRHSLEYTTSPTRKSRNADLLPSSNDAFVRKVRDNVVGLRVVLDEVSALHVKSIEGQLQHLLQAQAAGHDLKESAQSYAATRESERILKEQVESRVHDLRALREELEVQHQLSPEEKEEVLERIKLDFEKCESELNLLQRATPLADVPEGTLHTLVGVYQLASRGQPLTDGMNDWADNFSPMHWAAQNARRDIIEYLIKLRGGVELLNARDNLGRTPLYYANGARWPELAQYLVEAGATMPMHAVERRPSVSSLPPQYAQVLQQIETHGWHSMNWKDNFTMLHWAAEKDNADLCRYLISLDADPNMRDSKDRDPFALAAKFNCLNAQAALEDAGNVNMNLQAFRGSVRGSVNNASRIRSSTLGSIGSLYEENLAPSDSAATSSVPDVTPKAVPEAYIKVINQIESMGWEKMLWARGFTLLHWAAKNDMADLINHFMFRKADPEHRDDSGRSALDYATDAGSSAALAMLQRGAPSIEPKLGQLTVSKKARSSILVEGRVRPSATE